LLVFLQPLILLSGKILKKDNTQILLPTKNHADKKKDEKSAKTIEVK
tara:strand:- start:149 stop:289 length:141 start_codon:yes stop_codon:yes gene_type:complete